MEEGKMKSSVYHMHRNKEGRIYVHICSGIWKSSLQWEDWSPPEGKVMCLGAGGRDLLFTESPFVPLEIWNPGNASPIQKIS